MGAPNLGESFHSEKVLKIQIKPPKVMNGNVPKIEIKQSTVHKMFLDINHQ